jgi:PTH1 family peptidyl-tRNA hydrolase
LMSTSRARKFRMPVWRDPNRTVLPADHCQAANLHERSGSAVSSLLHYFKVPLERLLVIHDDLDLPLGVLRLASGRRQRRQRGHAVQLPKSWAQRVPAPALCIGRPPGRMDPRTMCLKNSALLSKNCSK